MKLNTKIFNDKTVLVLGDIILDHFIYGLSDRISPEAPVPIVQVQSENYNLGGAANVANNIKKLGGNCILVGSIGNDSYGKKVSELIINNSINFKPYKISNHRTTTKSRVFINHQQISRLDYEQTDSQKVMNDKKFTLEIEKYIVQSDIVIISDYCKGFLSEDLIKFIINFSHLNQKIIVADTKKIDLTCYAGVDYITPNVKELGDICGKKIPNEKNKIKKNSLDIIDKFNLQNIVVTRSDKGACIVNKKDSIFFNRKKIKVYDVTGAGDSFISIFGLLKSINASEIDLLKISTLVGSISVSKPGTYAVSINEILKRDYNE
tara:strand:+ start:760 stop:1722 length:963 start_codon:yes stop_codon:yes gene_type:complete